MIKKMLIIVGILLVIYIAFVTVDCFRLKNSRKNTQPLILFSVKNYETDNRIGTIYNGLGYNIEYYNNKNNFGYGTEIKLFNVITLYKDEAQ